jgi:hypothetical protein
MDDPFLPELVELRDFGGYASKLFAFAVWAFRLFDH